MAFTTKDEKFYHQTLRSLELIHNLKLNSDVSEKLVRLCSQAGMALAWRWRVAGSHTSFIKCGGCDLIYGPCGCFPPPLPAVFCFCDLRKITNVGKVRLRKGNSAA